MDKAICQFFVILLSWVSVSYAQHDNLKFETYSTIEGLSSSTCVEIFQDSEGFLWFGTIDGLNKYDGYGFEIYRPSLNDPHSISNNRVNAIVEDTMGNLWIGTSNGLNILHRGSEKFYRIERLFDVGHGANTRDVINDLFFEKETNLLWVASRKGLSKLPLESVDVDNLEDVEIINYVNDPKDEHSIDNNNVTGIRHDRENNIWVVTQGEYLNRYLPNEDRFERIPIKVPETFGLNHIPKNLLIDSEGDFWIGNNLSKLVFYDRATEQFQLLSLTEGHLPIFHLYQDSKGMIWVATDGYGIYILDKEKGIVQHVRHDPANIFSLPNDQPSKILEDKDGIFWVATYNKGISKLDLSKSSFGHYFHQPGNKNSLSTAIAQSVLEDSKGRIWIGTDGGGLNLFSEKDRSYKHFHTNAMDASSLSSDKILYLHESHDGKIWVCTWDGGLNKFDPATGKAVRFTHRPTNPYSIGQNTVWSAVEDSSHRLWLGTQTDGLNLFDPQTERFYSYTNVPGDPNSLISNFVFSTFIDSQNRLFVGTALGLNVVELDNLDNFIPEEIEFKEVGVENIRGYRINYIFEDTVGNIWVGSDLGLHKLTNDLTLVQSFSIEDGLPNNLILGISEDDEGYIWMTTKKGLSRLNPVTKVFKNFNIHDGLQGMEFQSKSIDKTEDGRIIIGGINGFNLFNPTRIYSERDIVTPFINKLRLNNKVVKVGDTIHNRILLTSSISKTQNLELKYNESYVSFEFVALNYQNPDRIYYSYMMNGLDDGFIEVGDNRVANYSNLPAGDYTFEVRTALDADWDLASSSTIQLRVLPPPWKTWWAYTIYGILLILMVGFGMKYYTRLVREEKEHELDQQKLRFFINVSHEFRTPLTLILNPAEKILTSFNDAEVVKSSAITIQRSASRLLNLINQLLDFRKMDLGEARLELIKGDIVKYSKDIFSLFEELAKMKGVRLRFKSSDESIFTRFDPDKYEKIITNLLSNALKFTGHGGTITFSIKHVEESKKHHLRGRNQGNRGQDHIEINISDTGIGFKKEHLKDVFKRFFHGDSTKTGTGIGLNFTKTLVELHGGEINVESEYKRGSVFTVTLPFDSKNDTIESDSLNDYEFSVNAIKATEYEVAITDFQLDREQVEEQTVAVGPDDKLPVVLIVEDNKELRTHLKNELSGQYTVKEAINGEEGLEKVKKSYPDIIISDVMMPKMDGFEFCRHIKSEFDTCHIPIILLTARSLIEDKIEGFKTGADEYLPKPFNVSILKARIKNLLDAKKRLRDKFASMGTILPSSELTSNSLDEAFLDKATKVVLENVGNIDFKLDDLLREIGVGRSQFYRKINSLTGQNPSNFIRTIRLKYASELLLKEEYSIKEVTHNSGFNSTAYFSKTFKELYGLTPSQFIAQKNKENTKKHS